jgi:capsular polysaccharide biosynthesis protein
MGVETKVRERDRPPDPNAEDELDLARSWHTLVVRWWVVLAGLIAGALLGYLLSLGGDHVYEAKATIYLGQPLSPNGTSQIQGLSTNPSTVREIVQAVSAQREAEARAGMAAGSLSGHVSTEAVAGAAPALGRPGQTPLVEISVSGRHRAATARASNTLAAIVIRDVSAGYVETKIKFLERQVAAQTDDLRSIDATIATLRSNASDHRLGTTDRLILASQLNGQTLQRGQVVDQLAQYQQLLALAKNVEQSRLVSRARATETTARSRRNSMIVGAAIGLVLGLAAALLWRPAGRYAGRASQKPGRAS